MPPELEFSFDEKKATQVAARIMCRNEDHCDYLALVKLLYIVDREAIKSWGRPISGGPYFSLPHGPVNSPVLDLANEKVKSDHWKSCIAKDGNELTLVSDPGDDELSEAEKDLIDFVFEQVGHLSPTALRHLTHQLPEWQDPGSSRIPITGESILRAVGRADDEIIELSSEVRDSRSLRSLLEL